MTALFLSLAALLAPADASLADAMQQVTTQPAQYLEAHPGTADRLWASKDVASDPSLPWLALVDELMARNIATEIDWKTDRDELLFQLEDLAGYALLSETSRKALAELEREDALTVNWLRDIAAQAASDGLIVAVMDIDSDSYITLLLPEADYTRANQGAQQLGQVLRDIREFDPNAG